MEPDFGGYATKAGLKCSDGRVIKAEAFAHMNGKTVPLVWQHGHNDPGNLLGHALLEARDDGIYAYGFFNGTENAKHAKEAVQHRDIDSLSIYANNLKEMNKIVSHGNIRELSLVLSGANPGAKIDQVRMQHSSDPDDFTDLEDEAIISHMGEIELPSTEKPADPPAEAEKDEVVEHADNAGETVGDIYNSFNEKQLNVVHYMIGAALEEQANSKAGGTDSGDSSSAEHSDTDEGIAHQEGNTDMGRNVFDQTDAAALTGTESGGKHVISHSDIQAIFAEGKKRGSFREAAQEYVLEHGITNIEALFPEARLLTNTPEFDKRRTEWVSDVLASTHKTPFAKIKTLVADLTQDVARAKGYIKGNYKIEEWIGVTQRTTSPTTIYKKQKLDRDDILDISDFDVVAWLMAEMRLMLEEELARAILIGDGRSVGDADKIKDPLGASDGTGIRSILNDHEVYVTTLVVDVPATAAGYEAVVDAVMDGMEFYKGTGTPVFYTTVKQLNKFKKAKDGNGRRYYENNQQVAEALGVSRVVTVEPMNEVAGLIGIIVNLQDYNLGTNKGGEITSFEQFDIDYNQEKYLLETRLSGALVRVKTALVIKEELTGTATAVVPLKPSFNASTGVITIPTVTGVVYKDSGGNTLTAGAQAAIVAGTTATIYTVPSSSSYYFETTADTFWPFTRPGA